MKSVAIKYGLVIGIFMTVVMTIFCLVKPSIMVGLLPMTILGGLTLGLMIFFNITRKNENPSLIIPYHEAFIATFLIGFVGIIFYHLSGTVLKGVIFPEIPEMEKNITLKYYDDLIAKAEAEVNKTGEKPQYSPVDVSNFKKNREAIAESEYNPVKNLGNTLLTTISSAGLISAFLAVISAFFGFQTQPKFQD